MKDIYYHILNLRCASFGQNLFSFESKLIVSKNAKVLCDRPIYALYKLAKFKTIISHFLTEWNWNNKTHFITEAQWTSFHPHKTMGQAKVSPNSLFCASLVLFYCICTFKHNLLFQYFFLLLCYFFMIMQIKSELCGRLQWIFILCFWWRL